MNFDKIYGSPSSSEMYSRFTLKMKDKFWSEEVSADSWEKLMSRACEKINKWYDYLKEEHPHLLIDPIEAEDIEDLDDLYWATKYLENNIARQFGYKIKKINDHTVMPHVQMSLDIVFDLSEEEDY